MFRPRSTLLILAVSVPACTEHAPSFYNITDEAPASTGPTTTRTSPTENATASAATTTDGGGVDGGNTTTAASDSAETGPGTGDETESSDTTATSSGLPIDPPPTVANLKCDPEEAPSLRKVVALADKPQEGRDKNQ